jgi:exopolysaccharide biosynthesis protein
MTLKQLAQVFVDRGAVVAYNLDGGGSSTLWFNGQIINKPTDGRTSGERKVSDILYIGA